jgi:LmbE family N-acetylglucosaminyl deacetylase
MKKENLLVIEAHSDDSAISVSGFLDKHRARYRYHFLLMTLSDVVMHHAGLVTAKQRAKEYAAYVRSFGGVWQRDDDAPLDADGSLDQVPRRELVGLVERTIASVKPAVILCQGPSFHQDHTATYEAMIAATRPTARFFPRAIYVMENPTYVHSAGVHQEFKPDVYVSLSKAELDKKLARFQRCFPSQLRPGRNCLSVEGIRSWARYRGIEARCQYAEALKTYIRVV